MKTRHLYSILIIICFFIGNINLIGQVTSLQVSGPTSLQQGQIGAYTVQAFNSSGNIISSPQGAIAEWHVYGGSYQISVSGLSANITFTGSGSYVVEYSFENYSGDVVLGDLNVTVGTPAPPAPNTSFTIIKNCGNTIVMRNSDPPSGYEWYWYNGSSELGTGTSCNINSDQPLYLRSRLAYAPYTIGGAQTVGQITVNPSPTGMFSGGGSYCQGGGGVLLGLDGSQSGVTYQLYYNGSPDGSPIGGTGSAISFGNRTQAGAYMVSAHSTINGCNAPLTGSAIISINPLPTEYNVIGGGIYCIGGSGVVIGLSSSETGVNYQLYKSSSVVGTTYGTGSSIDFGYKTTEGIYTVKAIDAVAGCSTVMLGNATVSIASLPNPYTVTGGGDYCRGGSGIAIGLSNSTIGVNYQLYKGTSPLVSIVPGTSFAISFGNQTAEGIYTVKASTSYLGCSNNMIGSGIVNTISLPAIFTVTGGGSYCNGGIGIPIGLNGSETNVIYSLYNNSILISSLNGTGSSLNFGNQTVAGLYTVTATNASSCVSAMTGSAAITINDLPTAYTITGGGGYCNGGIGVAVGLNGSATGVNYQLYNGSTSVGTSVAGTGSSFNFGNQTSDGSYTVKATNANSCVSAMTGSATVTINALPAAYTVTGGGGYCSGGSGATVGLNGSVTGVNYQLYNGSSTVGTAVAGTGSAISFGNQTLVTAYTVKATNATTSCVSDMTGSASVTINALPTPTITGNSTGSVSNSSIYTTETSMTGYTWTATGGTVTSGAGTNQASVTWSTAGNGSVSANYTNANGCKASVVTSKAVTIYDLPVVTQQPLNIVQRVGTNATFNAAASGTDLTYQWRKNKVNIANATLHAYTIKNIQAADIGTFDVMIMGAGGGTVISNTVTLKIASLQALSGMNYIATRTILSENITDPTIVPTLPVENMQESVAYFDGLGRPIQQVIWQGTPSKQDIVQDIEYDQFDRETIKYLPFTEGADGSYKNNAITVQEIFYQTAVGVTHDNAPYSQTVFENSPLQRILQQGAPGTVWQPSSGHAIGIGYRNNNAAEVIRWDMVNDTTCQRNGNYAANTLFVTQTTDENDHCTMEYKDKEGHVILKKTYLGTDSIQTYYVYDDYGLLRYVLPPKAVAGLSATTLNTSDNLVKQLCYYYKYDDRHRMTLKQIPGASPVCMVYDDRDRLVATQDGNMRKNNKWSFTKYDELNRPVMTGLKQITSARDELQKAVNDYYTTSTNVKKWYESKDATVGQNIGYTLTQSYPTLVESDLLTITYYDDYTYPDTLGFTPRLGNTTNNTFVKGQVTGTRIRVLGDNTHWYTTTSYYDDKYRVIQTTRQNNIGGTDRVTNRYDFVGKIDTSLYNHIGKKNVTIAKRFLYDHAGRLVKVFHKIDSNPEILMSYMVYNEIGQLVDKKIHSTDAAQVKYLQSIDYRYNIRGWLTHINNANLGNLPTDPTQDDLTNEKADAFGMEIKYNDLFK